EHHAMRIRSLRHNGFLTAQPDLSALLTYRAIGRACAPHRHGHAAQRRQCGAESSSTAYALSKDPVRAGSRSMDCRFVGARQSDGDIAATAVAAAATADDDPAVFRRRPRNRLPVDEARPAAAAYGLREHAERPV